METTHHTEKRMKVWRTIYTERGMLIHDQVEIGADSPVGIILGTRAVQVTVEYPPTPYRSPVMTKEVYRK